MASARRRKSTAVTRQLQAEPQRFEFFQAVRLLEIAARLYRDEKTSFAQVPVALGAPPHKESIRFRAQASLAFRGSDIERVDIVKSVEQDDDQAPRQQWQMLVNIFGLFGSTGILPYHISELVIKRLRQKDRSLVDFLDVINHRSTSLYYQSWHKYRLPVVFERGKLGVNSTDSAGAPAMDMFSQVIASLMGLGTAHLQSRLPIADAALMGFGGQLARFNRSAPALARMLQHYFELPITIEQFIGQWQTLPDDIQSRLPGRYGEPGQNHQLGMNVLLGRQCWEIQSKFRVKLSELSYRQFISISPRSAKMAALKAFVRFVVGTEFDFDIEISISHSQIPRIGLGKSAMIDGMPLEGGELMLGWNCGLDNPDHTRTGSARLIRILVSE